MLKGLRKSSFSQIQLNAGVFLRDVDWRSAADASELKQLIAAAMEDPHHALGLTRSGGSFTCKPTVRYMEADGLRSDTVGATLCDRWEVRLSGTMLEMTPENMALCLACAETEETAAGTRLTSRGELTEASCIPSLLWVGSMAGGGLLLIELKNALNTGGVSLDFRDRGEGTLPFSFLAHADADDDALPFEIFFMKKGDGE